MSKKIDVAVLGATGAVGQRFIQLLEDHPWFQVTELVGKSSAGKRYGDAVNWVLNGNPPESVVDLTVKPLDAELDAPLVFSALPKEAAVDREPQLASAGHIVCTNAGAHRMAKDVPLLIPEVNADHVQLVDVQRANRDWTTGALIANSNCTVMPLVMALAPLRQFGIRRVSVVSEQAISGAGYPGVASLDILDNVIPYVGGDEDKMQTESLKMLGTYVAGQIDLFDAVVSATCTRVPVIDGHLVNISVDLESKPSIDEIITAWGTYQGDSRVALLPSAPEKPLQYLSQIDRPQPRRDRDAGKGMMTSIGRLRECPVLGYKFAALSHNTIRGAAGSSILNAELLAVTGYIPSFEPELAQALP
ncbi:aspartate-semialdehyde dehydrogenase [Phototrophicus methaneseepsis]|uniref:Aspartate-semialdehyde dehydrogenase n=1 Tax=Phototrophicus methaneseepsis TaxID=2710758 RepID=A0A7S8IDW0_9CHLR|nr:aspartate-semialdehyde dehydrogenase [Phototrophicus methaneseepsis]QPC81223.1 aspartate-semialdehyde dehydrogenase [Phototrophicus methaneseepsis]